MARRCSTWTCTPTLLDLDLYAYSVDIERVRVKGGWVAHKDAFILPFDEHYCLAAEGCAQRKRPRLVIPRIVDPQCPSFSANKGGEHALYKHLLFTPLRCRGGGHCADPRNCQPFLFRNAAGKFSFKQSWKARRAQIQLLADVAEEKLQHSKRIYVAEAMASAS